MRRFTYEYPFPGALGLPNKYGTITLLSDGPGLRNRVIPFPTHGVASTQPTGRQQRTLEQTVAINRLIRIVRTGRVVAAPASQDRGEQTLVPSDQRQTQSFHRNSPLLRNRPILSSLPALEERGNQLSTPGTALLQHWVWQILQRRNPEPHRPAVQSLEVGVSPGFALRRSQQLYSLRSLCGTRPCRSVWFSKTGAGTPTYGPLQSLHQSPLSW